MHKIHRTLHLQHHKHTGRLLHHRHTSYRGLAVVFAVAGLSMWGLSALSKATADTTFGVAATVLAPVPSSAASIVTPASNATLASASTIVVGTCPLITPQVNVVITADGTPVGSGICDANNDFTIPVTLASGSHTLVAQTYTLTDQQGPASAPVAVTAPATTTAPAPSLSADQPLSFLATDSSVDWTGTVAGGTAPYRLRVDWGNGHQQTTTLASAGPQHLTFTYATATPRNMTLFLTDATGATTMTQYAVAAYATAAPVSAMASGEPTGFVTTRTMFGLYGLFVTVVAVTGIVAIEGRKVRKEHRFA